MYIIDTHILLWLLSEPERLTATAKKILQEDELYISMASFDSKFPLYPVQTAW